MSTSWKKKVELEARNRRRDALEFLRRVYWGASSNSGAVSSHLQELRSPRQGGWGAGVRAEAGREPPLEVPTQGTLLPPAAPS